MRKPAGGLVYSTEGGRMCPQCRKPVAACDCKAPAAVPAGDGVARVALQTKGRAGKAVTVVRGLTLDPAALAALGKALRAACGSGGTVKEGTLEIQGDHVAQVLTLLAERGVVARRQAG